MVDAAIYANFDAISSTEEQIGMVQTLLQQMNELSIEQQSKAVMQFKVC